MNDSPIRALLVDIDGTVCQRGRLIPGGVEALEALDRRGVPHLFVTNMTSRSRAGIVRWLASMGLPVAPERIFTGARAARDRLVAAGKLRCTALVASELLEDFDGLDLVDERPDAVIVGDMGEAWRFEALDRAFRAVLDGAELVALARNRYFLNHDGVLTLDVGPFVVALEYATGRSATLAGKPSPDFFRLALDAAGVAAGEAAMVGDDLEGDVGGAQSAGLRGVLVRTGKYREEALAASSVRPDVVVDSLASVADLF